MDLDSLLFLEEQFYQEGYNESRQENLQKNFLEGKQYGLQVGFQRYIMLGQLKGICEILLNIIEDNTLIKHMEFIKQSIDKIPLDNNEESVTTYEKLSVKIRNKFRILLMGIAKKSLNIRNIDKFTFEKVEEISKCIGGKFQGYYEDGYDNNDENSTANNQSPIW